MCHEADSRPNITARMTLDDEIPEVQNGDVLEINLFGSGVARLYASLLYWPGGGRGAKVITAVEMLDLVIERYEGLLDQRTNRAHRESWVPVILRLQQVEEFLANANIPGASENALLINDATRRLLTALQAEADLSPFVWTGVLDTLRVVRGSCAGMAQTIESTAYSRETRLGVPRFVPFDQGLRVKNLEQLARGLELAAEACVEMNVLEVGLVLERGTAEILRGPVYA